jgi:hypothetical protein
VTAETTSQHFRPDALTRFNCRTISFHFAAVATDVPPNFKTTQGNELPVFPSATCDDASIPENKNEERERKKERKKKEKSSQHFSVVQYEKSIIFFYYIAIFIF